MPRRARQPEPEFFVDRSLGRYEVADALTAAGSTVHTLASVYGEHEGQHVTDVDWLEHVGARGWAVLMKDDHIRRRPAEIQALELAGVRAFCLTNANLRGEQMAARFVHHRNRIIQCCRRPGPYIMGVYDDRLTRLWPR